MWDKFWKHTWELLRRRSDLRSRLRCSTESGKTDPGIFARCHKERGLHLGEGKRESAALRWTHWRSVRSGSGGWLHLHDETRPPGGGQNPRPGRRTVFACYSAAAWWQSAIWWPTLW